MRILAATFVLSLSLLTQSAQIPVLEAGKPIEASMSSKQRQTFQLTLQAGEFAHVVVAQRGVDVILRWSSPDGTRISDFQDDIRKNGEEHAIIVADTSGTYSLAVIAAIPGEPSGTYVVRLAETRPATTADRSRHEASRLRTEASVYYAAGKCDEGVELYKRALALSEAAGGPDDISVARVARDLATCYVDRRSYAEAESLYQRAIAIMERELGVDDPSTALVWSRLAIVYGHTGPRLKAEKLIQRALDVIEKTLGPHHPEVARAIATLAVLRLEAGDVDESEALDRRALAIAEATDGPESRLAADLLNNLGTVDLGKKDYARADEFFRRALSIGERRYGSDSFWAATVLNNLGITARQRKEYDQAEIYYLRALAIHEKTLGPDHPDIAAHLNNLAIVYNNKGNVARALETHFRALQIRERSTGPYSAATLASLGNIARTYAAAGQTAKSLEFQQRADTVLEIQLALNLAIGSERQKLAFAETALERTDRTISLNVLAMPTDPGASALAALVVLQRKGRVLDAMTDTLGTLRQRAGSATDRELLDQLKATTTELARLVLNAPERMPADEREKAMKALEVRKERVEAAISDHSAEFRARTRPVTLPAVQGAMPEEAALIEFAVFRPFDPKAASNSEAYGSPHYVAYVTTPHGVPRGTDLGPAAAITAAVEAFRGALRDPTRTDVTRLARAVDERVLQPLRASMGNATRLLISPDGELNLIPFEALVDPKGHYAIEGYSISYLSSGRDLLRMQVPRESRSGPVLVADPFFGEPAAPVNEARPQRSARLAQRRSVTSGTELSSLYFAPLAGTSQEARAIRSLFPEATLLTRGEATKAALARLEAPRILHIATHGFFLQNATDGAASAAPGQTRGSTAAAPIANPLLRSGLALAGANVDKGVSVLTALEASNLNLWGTKLVTLSACDTGVGQVRNGEGIYGLRRSFFLAGAETLVMSLWPVSDYVTRETMTAYYTGLKAGLGRGEALRKAQLAMLARQTRRHPFYWASFIQAGDWTPLDNRR